MQVQYSLYRDGEMLEMEHLVNTAHAMQLYILGGCNALWAIGAKPSPACSLNLNTVNVRTYDYLAFARAESLASLQSRRNNLDHGGV